MDQVPIWLGKTKIIIQLDMSQSQSDLHDIFKGMERIYHADQIDFCNQFNSDWLSKYTWGWCLGCWMQTCVMKVCEQIIGTNNAEL